MRLTTLTGSFERKADGLSSSSYLNELKTFDPIRAKCDSPIAA